MVEVKSKLKLYLGEKFRKTPFESGYRPLFNFISQMKTSGQIVLLDRDFFSPGDEGIVLIKFLNSQYLGIDFGEGKRFTFDEGRETLGDGEILEVINGI